MSGPITQTKASGFSNRPKVMEIQAMNMSLERQRGEVAKNIAALAEFSRGKPHAKLLVSIYQKTVLLVGESEYVTPTTEYKPEPFKETVELLDNMAFIKMLDIRVGRKGDLLNMKVRLTPLGREVAEIVASRDSIEIRREDDK